MVKTLFEDIGQYFDYLCEELKNYLAKNKIENVVIGVSGGIDSAVSLAILAKVLPAENIYAYNLIIDHTTSRKEIEALIEKYKVPIDAIDLTSIYDAYSNLSVLETSCARVFANIKSRIRMNFLYAMAAKNKAIVIGSLNYTEYYLGYFTKFGDSAVDFNLLGGLAKVDVYALADYLDVPQVVIDKEPTADLLPNQTDEKDLGVTYSALNAMTLGEVVSTKDAKKAKEWHSLTNHKRKAIKLETYRKYALRNS